MKDYKRLTKPSSDYPIGGVLYCRLKDIEDKIESGEIDYVADRDKEIARLIAENARLKEQTKDFEVLYAGIKNGEVDMSVRGTTLKAITACFIQAFIQNGGTNFFLYDLQDDDGNKYSVTIQKATGKTPAEMLHESKAEIAELRTRLEKAVELPVKVGDTIYCIRNCGTGRYRVEEHTVIEVVFEYDNQMRIKTSYGLFGCEKWTFGLDCFADRAKAEARLAELKGGDQE